MSDPNMREIGPNEKRLIIHKMSLLAIPTGSGERSLELGVKALMSPVQIFRDARAWVKTAIAAVKAAPDCTFTSDEEIAGVILKGIDERIAKQSAERKE